MKVTVELDDELLRQVEARVAERDETFEAFLERGLRCELATDVSRKYGSG